MSSPNRDMRILMVANYYEESGGISGQVKLLSSHLREEGYTVEIHSLAGPLFKRLSAYLKLIFGFRSFGIVHIHACSHRGFLPALAGVPVFRMRKKRVVLTFHGGEGDVFFKKHPRLCRYVFSRTDANIVLSGFLGDVFKSHGYPYVMIPNIIDLPQTTFRQRKEFRPRFLSVRALKPEYNVLCTIHAFETLKKDIPDARLDILGDGSQRAELEDYVRENGVKDVYFHGTVPNSEMTRWLSEADVFVSSPLVDNQPMSVLEAFSCGPVVISSNVGGIPYMIEDGVNGYLFESGDSTSLCRKMRLAVEDQDKSAQITSNAFSSLGRYKWESIKPEILEVYNLSKEESR